MKIWVCMVMTACCCALGGVTLCAYAEQVQREGAYQVLEGNVTSLAARKLVINGQQYPVSMFARVFKDSLKGQEMPLHTVVNVGRIDQAKLYLLGGKVEKIVVLKNM